MWKRDVAMREHSETIVPETCTGSFYRQQSDLGRQLTSKLPIFSLPNILDDAGWWTLARI